MDEIDAGDPLGDGVLHLKTRVHLQEIEILLRVDQKLDGAGRRVADLFGQCHGAFAHGFPRLRIDERAAISIIITIHFKFKRAVSAFCVYLGASSTTF